MGFLCAVAALFFVLFATAAWITVSCYYLTPRSIRKAMAKQGIYGPAPRFLVGNLKEIASFLRKSIAADMEFISHDLVGRLLPHYVRWSEIYGKTFVYWYGSEPRLCLSNADMIKEFLSSKYVQLTGRSWLQKQGSKHLIGDGLIMANGHRWLHQRRVVSPAFMADRLKSDAGYMVNCTKKMISSLLDAVSRSGGGENEVEIGEYLTRLAGDIISRTEFDTSYEKGRQMFHLLGSLQSLTARSSSYLWIPGNRFFPSSFRREIKELKAKADRLLTEMIQSSKDGAEIGRSSSYGKGLLGILLSETQKKRDGSSIGYDLELVMDECKTFFFAGHETSALLLTWTVMLLATNPAWQDRARAEVAEVCAGEPPSFEQLSKLTLLNMIINESLRLYPPATMLPRMVFEDIELGNLHIPKGVSIWIPVLAIHHDKEIWGKDAHEFNPERFAGGKSFAQARQHFLPFATGPRNCVGQAYAVMEAKIVLTMLLYSFSFAISRNYRHAPINVLTLKPKYGVPVYLTPLKSRPAE